MRHVILLAPVLAIGCFESDDSGTDDNDNCFAAAVVAQGAVDLSVGGEILGNVATNGTGECVVNVDHSDIVGDVEVGVGGDDATDVCVVRAGSLSGSTGVRSTALDTPWVTAPSGLPATSGALALSGFETAEIAQDTVFDSITLEVGSTLTVTADAVVHVLGDVDVNHSSFVVDEGVTLQLFVDGDFIVQRAGDFGRDGDASGADVRLTSGGSVSVSVGSSVYAGARTDGDVTVDHSDWTGAVAGSTVTVQRAATLSEDTSLLCD